MSQISEALSNLPPGPGEIHLDGAHGSAQVDVLDVDRLGVRVRGVVVRHAHPREVAPEAYALPERLRALPERIVPIEVAPSLGGAVLKTDPQDLRGGDYFEVAVTPGATTVGRTHVDEQGERSPTDWAMTHEQLERLVDQLGQPTDTTGLDR